MAISLISYNLINKYLEIQKIQKINEFQSEEINNVRAELVNIKNSVESIKIKDNLVNSMGFKR